MREGLVTSVKQQDPDAAQEVQQLMVIWEDMTIVGERSLQQVLRAMDTKKLALAMVKVDPAIAAKISGNISERANTMLEEEASLLSAPKDEEIEQARETILNALREMNAKGELEFDEGEDQ